MSIKLLSNDVINKIAAGEVVERPRSIVKELVENSVDACSTKIDIFIEQGGKKKIVVKDNGLGISYEDSSLCLVRHATSKISSGEDLFSISTMGFRGEALSSISSVSRLELISYHSGSTGFRLGVNLEENSGDFFVLPREGVESGTTVTVRDLFFNIPARLAFLKSDKSEEQAIVETVQGLSIAHPHVDISLYQAGKCLFQNHAVEPMEDRFGEQALRERACPIFKTSTLSDMVYAQSVGKYLNLEMLLSKPSIGYSNSRGILFFVNSRQVENKNLRSSFLRGYQSYIMKGKYPCGICLLTVDPTLVDVNVSPTKNQVRFQYEKETLGFLIKTVQETLRKGDWLQDRLIPGSSFSDSSKVVPVKVDEFSLIPSQSLKSSPELTGSVLSQSFYSSSSFSSRGTRRSDRSDSFKPKISEAVPILEFSSEEEVQSRRYQPAVQDRILGASYQETSTQNRSLPVVDQKNLFENTDSISSQNNLIQRIDWASMKYLGSYANCYLFLEYQDKLVVIDQHAFHERVLYEKMIKDPSYLNQRQQLLVYESITLNRDDFEKACEYKNEFEKLGFSFNTVADSVVEISQIPAILANSDIETVFTEILEGIDLDLNQDGSFTGSSKTKKIYETIACHSAVRSGEGLDETQVRQLFKLAQEVEFCWSCPHGRNCFKFFDKTQVEKWFDRI